MNPRLTVITTDSPNLQTRSETMTNTDYEARKSELSKRSINVAQAHEFPLGSVRYKLESLSLEDHAYMVHNALEAVRCLAIPEGAGFTVEGYQIDLSAVTRNSFVDLIEIINDRLGYALEKASTSNMFDTMNAGLAACQPPPQTAAPT
jgi:hypothetical protein